MSENDNRQKVAVITVEAAKLLVSQQGIIGAQIEQVNGKWIIFFRGKTNKLTLRTARGQIKLFKNLETATETVKNCGLGSVTIQLENWNTKQGEL